MTKKARKTLTIDRGLWGTANLRHRNGVQCCLGFAARAAGVSAKDCLDASMPSGLYPDQYNAFRTVWPDLDGNLQQRAAEINDDGISGPEKEKALKALFKEAGIRLRFVGEYSRKKDAVRKAARK